MPRTPADTLKPLKSLAWDGGLESGRLVVLDQTRLPGTVRYLPLRDLDGVVEAIAEMSVRGAPAIGIAGAYGVVLHLIPRASAATGKGSAVLAKHLENQVVHSTGQISREGKSRKGVCQAVHQDYPLKIVPQHLRSCRPAFTIDDWNSRINPKLVPETDLKDNCIRIVGGIHGENRGQRIIRSKYGALIESELRDQGIHLVRTGCGYHCIHFAAR